MQASTSAQNLDSDGCTNLFRFQNQESCESLAPLPLSSLTATYGAVLRNASPVFLAV